MGEENSMESAVRPVTRFTYDDLLAFPEDGKRREIIEGALVVTASPSVRHQRVSIRLAIAVGNYLAAHSGVGEVLHAPVDVVLEDGDVVVPDLVVVTADQRDVVTAKYLAGAPAIVVEILSPSSRRMDEKTKRAIYDRHGVREYWVVDPDVDEVRVYRRDADGALPRVPTLGAEQQHLLTTPLLPEFSLSLIELFRE